MTNIARGILCGLLAATLYFPLVASAGGLPVFDFTSPAVMGEWKPAHDLSGIEGGTEGMVLRIDGADPYAIGPARDYPAGVPLRMTIRLRSEQGGMAQVFYFQKHASEARSVRFDVRAGRWVEPRLHLPSLGPGYHLRFDPPGDRGTCVVQRIAFAVDEPLHAPAWPAPIVAKRDPQLTVTSGQLSLSHSKSGFEAFSVAIAGEPTAIGWSRGLIGYVRDGKAVWVRLDDEARAQASRQGAGILEAGSIQDPGGATWQIRRAYAPSARSNAIDVETTISVDRDRDVIFLPMFGLFPGVGSFGTSKQQALFAGLEYLGADEPSSSEADVIGPASKRQVPNSLLKITFPLMSVAAQGRYAGLIWERRPEFAAMFDSPDRLFNTGGHAMGVLFPGSNGDDRVEGSLLPDEPRRLAANTPLVLHATIIGGQASDVTAGIQQYVALRGLPPVPHPMAFADYAKLAATGWLDSQARVGGEYRHAIPGGFAAHPAADAALLQEWLANQSIDLAQRARLQEAAGEAIAKVNPGNYDGATVSHIVYPVQSLAFGHVAENAEQSDRRARALLERFEPDGSVRYRPPATGLDLGKTSATPEANGLTAALVASVLQDATMSGKRDLIDRGLALLRALDKFAGTVPRGAQTWEVPLHTPDILASAHLIRAYTLGYELSGDARFLEQAKYWAWAGVPFVYLTDPAEPVGRYAGIAVFGATQWRAPVWMGLPVQWCALVYADALDRLMPYDPPGPWKTLADGITASGIQQTWPIASDSARRGLLPDSFNLVAQSRNDPAINPGTLMADAIRFYDRGPLYDFRCLRKAGGMLVHAPGRISDLVESADRASFKVDSWLNRPYHVLISGVRNRPQVRLNGAPIDLHESPKYAEADGRLILELSGRTTIEVRDKSPG